jgi:hypothetical protein
MNYFPSFVPCSPNNIGYRTALCGRAAGSLGDRANTGWVNDLSLADCRHFPHCLADVTFALKESGSRHLTADSLSQT